MPTTSLCDHCGNYIPLADHNLPSTSNGVGLLGTNIAPEELQQASIREFLRELEIPSTHNKADISRIEEYLQSLRLRQTALAQVQRSYRRLLHSIHRVPPEILASIFLFCLDHSRFGRVPPQPSSSNAPLVLTHVSRRWRDIAIRLPPLWTEINLHLRPRIDSMSYTFNHPVQVKTWLERSQHLPLSIIVSISAYRPDYSVLQPSIDLLIDNIHRWQSAVFAVSPAFYTASLAKAKGVAIPQSTRLEIRDHHHLDADNVAALEKFDIFLHAPKLSKLTLWDTEHSLPLPWTRLSHITVKDSFTFDFFAHEYLASVQSLHFEKMAPEFSEDIDSIVQEVTWNTDSGFPDVVVPQIHTLSSDSLAVALTVFRHLSLPGLVHLTLEDSGERTSVPNWFNLNFSPFLARSGCNIQHLELMNLPGLSDFDAIVMLTSMPSIVDLSIVVDDKHELSVGPILTTTFIRALTRSVLNTMCSKLRKITLYDHFGKFDDQDLFNMLFSRCSRPSQILERDFIPLLSANLHCRCRLRPDSDQDFTKAQVTVLKQKGLTLSGRVVFVDAEGKGEMDMY